MNSKFPTYFALSAIVITALTGCATKPPAASFVAPTTAMPSAEAIAETARKNALLRSLRFNEIDGKWELLLPEPLLFAFDQHMLTQSAEQSIQKMGASLAETKPREIIVVGHTDNVGSRDHNERLSLRRAQSVATALKMGGLKEKSIVVMGVANDVPIASNKTTEGRAENRRVAIIVEP
jgi:outer membrane protein OmpA-like peptidoglycan-associated protein